MLECHHPLHHYQLDFPGAPWPFAGQLHTIVIPTLILTVANRLTPICNKLDEAANELHYPIGIRDTFFDG